MKVVAFLALAFAGASALVMGPPAAAHVASRVAVSPVMACNGGKGGSGGMGPKKDKMRRGQFKKLLYVVRISTTDCRISAGAALRR